MGCKEWVPEEASGRAWSFGDSLLYLWDGLWRGSARGYGVVVADTMKEAAKRLEAIENALVDLEGGADLVVAERAAEDTTEVCEVCRWYEGPNEEAP